MLRAFLPLFLAVAASMTGLGVIAPILPLYAQSLGAGGAALGLMYAAFSASRMLLGPVMGRISDRVGRRRMIVVGLSAYAAVSLLYVIAHTIWQLAAFRFLHGFASVLVTPIAQAYVADLTPPGKEGRIMNLFYTSLFIGMALGPLIGGSLAERWGLVAPFFAMGALTFLALVGVLLFVPEDTNPTATQSARPPVKQVFRSPVVWGIVVYYATRGLWRQGFNAFWPLLGASFGHGEAAIGSILTAYLLAQAVTQIPCGYLADRYPRVRQIAAGGLLAPAVMFVVPSIAGSIAWMLGTGVMMGMASALGRASVVAIRTQSGRLHGMGMLIGTQSSGFAAGQALGPVLAGVAFDLGGLSAPMYLGGTLGLLGAVFASVVLFRGVRTELAATESKQHAGVAQN
ncbi:MAG: MFS transporter [Candidatus Bipolaricaulota bacterium]